MSPTSSLLSASFLISAARPSIIALLLVSDYTQLNQSDENILCRRNYRFLQNKGRDSLAFTTCISETTIDSATLGSLPLHSTYSSEGPSEYIIASLWSILSYDQGQPICLCHALFSDYLLSPGWGNDSWFIDVPFSKPKIALRCFTDVQDRLYFDICNLETSFVRNKDVLDLEHRVEDNISPHSQYACAYRLQSLSEVPATSPLFNSLSELAYDLVLFWMEVLNIMGRFREFASHESARAAS